MRRKRRIFFPVLILTVIFWGAFLYILLYIPPGSNLIVFALLSTLFFALFATASYLFSNSRLGFLVSVVAIFYLFLRLLKMANLLNLVLLFFLLLTTGFYFRKR